ncbi:ubiquitin C-terminal hydrolase [Encephalitozoon hellem]|nr:ubiquitin C-terminal hydrolase [Encephalitozoon hellem]
MADGHKGQSSSSDPRQQEYAISSIFAKAQKKFGRAFIGGKVSGARIHFVPEDTWKTMKESSVTEYREGNGPETRGDRRAVFVVFMIDELVTNTVAPEAGKSVIVRVGWIYSILKSLANISDFSPSEQPSYGNGMKRSRKIVNVLADPSDKLFDIVLHLMDFRLDLEGFMRNYRVLASNGRVIHPLAVLDELSDGDVLRISKIIRMGDGRALSVDEHMRNAIRGLKNQGNTCFMNSGLQCLMNCWKLTEYFISREYESHLEKHKPDHVSLANAYYDLVAQVHDGGTHPITPAGIKRSLGSIYEEYKGSDEQDTVEFITKMLDTLHEGLSTKVECQKKKEGRGWWDYSKSIVTDLFFFCLRSTLSCRACGRSKASVEPAMCLSLPVPHPMEHKNDIVLFYESSRKQPIKIYTDSSICIKELKKLLGTKYGVLGRVACIWYDGSRNMVEAPNDAILRNIPQALFCYEYFEGIEYCWIHLKIKKLFIDRSLQFNILIKAFAYSEPLMLLEVRRALIYLVQKESRDLLEDEDISPYVKLELPGRVSKEAARGFPVVIGVSRAHGGRKLLNPLCDPLDMIQAIRPPMPTLNYCIDKFLEKEDLHPSELLYCEGCGEKKMFSKKIDLESLPTYLIIQLKRFQYVNSFPVKISTLVEYPLDEFRLGDAEYRVIGVCNHDSETVTSSGHYVSYLWKDGWYLCNDQKIERVDKIKKEHTYVLFLERCG